MLKLASLPIAALIAMGGTAAYAVAMEFALFRPMRRKGSASLFIVTIGLALLMRHVLYIIAGARAQQYALDQAKVFELGPVRISPR